MCQTHLSRAAAIFAEVGLGTRVTRLNVSAPAIRWDGLASQTRSDYNYKKRIKIFYKNSKNVGMAQKGQKQEGMSR